MARLLSIEHDGPVRVHRLGQRHEGLTWTVQPENFPTVIEMVNTHGGPALWEITPLEGE